MTAKENKPEDLTGRSRFTVNVLASWGAYLVFVIAGFVMPRFIDEFEGQAALGVWDFAWSLVAYLNIAQIGVGSGVNRYVAKYRANGDYDELGGVVSTVVVLQICLATLVLMFVWAAVYYLPSMLPTLEGDALLSASWVVGLLGASVAANMALQASRGVIAGCHRWDINNYINAASHTSSVVCMLGVLVLGYGLIGMAVVYLVVVLITELFRLYMSRRVCKELVTRISSVSTARVKKMTSFGIKTFVVQLQAVIPLQLVSILVAAQLGPAALAVFSRPLALVRHVEAFMNKFANIFSPTVGALIGGGQRDELKRLFMHTGRYSIALAFPFLAALGVFGDVLLRVWMGDSYVHGDLVILLALGFFLPISHSFAMFFLIGMNEHGRVGLISLAASLSVVFVGIGLLFTVGWSLLGAGLVVALSYSVGAGIVVPIAACKKLEISIVEYLRFAMFMPILLGGVFILVLELVNHLLPWGPVINMLLAGLLAGISQVVLYWNFLLIPAHKDDLRLTIRKKLRLSEG